ncbi:MAG: hypothetical protein OHK0023_18230 [Anaerolineae bacterium]
MTARLSSCYSEKLRVDRAELESEGELECIADAIIAAKRDGETLLARIADGIIRISGCCPACLTVKLSGVGIPAAIDHLRYQTGEQRLYPCVAIDHVKQPFGVCADDGLFEMVAAYYYSLCF